MTNINFNEPSVGEVTVNQKAGLTVRNKGADNGWGLLGESINSVGVAGASTNWVGVWGKSDTQPGVLGWTSSNGTAGVLGEAKAADGGGTGVWGKSDKWVGVFGESKSKVGILGRAPVAGRFEGNVEVTGDISLGNSDCAEEFDVAESEVKSVEAGTVMVLTENGSLQSSYQEYDKKVAGVVSGASGYKPAIVLDRQNQSQNENQDNKNKDRLPIALMGKVYCKVDARHSSIEIGDLLTTSATRGYAMKAQDPIKAFGAVIGKALGSIKEGLGMVPVLVALQ